MRVGHRLDDSRAVVADRFFNCLRGLLVDPFVPGSFPDSGRADLFRIRDTMSTAGDHQDKEVVPGPAVSRRNRPNASVSGPEAVHRIPIASKRSGRYVSVTKSRP